MMRFLTILLAGIFSVHGNFDNSISTVTVQLDSTFTKESQWCYISGWISSDEYHIYDSIFFDKKQQTAQLKVAHSIEKTFHLYFSKCGPLNQDFILEPGSEVLLRVIPEPRNEEGTFILSGKGSEAFNEENDFRQDIIKPLMRKLQQAQGTDSISYYKQQIAENSIKMIKNTSHPDVACSIYFALKGTSQSFLSSQELSRLREFMKKRFPDIYYIQNLEQPYTQRTISEEAKQAKAWRTRVTAERRRALQQDTVVGSYIKLTFSDRDGKPVSIDDLHEEYVLVDFWASWCKPCLKEVPYIKSALEKYKRKMAVYAVSLDGNLDSWQSSIEANQLNDFVHVIGTDFKGMPNRRVQGIGVKTIPANFLLNKERRIVAKNLYGQQLIQTMDSLTQQ